VNTIRALRRRLGRDEEGFTLVELMGSLTLLAFGFIALATASSTGSRLLAQGKQRQAATEVASRQVEHIRNIPYDNVALSSTPAHSADPDNPDYWVSGDGYDHDENATYETLVTDTSDGHIEHVEDVTVGSTLLRAYHYVTWVDDPDVTGTEDYKRVTVVVKYLAPANLGRPQTVRASTLLTTGTVSIGGTAMTSQAGTVPLPSPSPAPVPSGTCSGDTTGPTGTFTILSGTGADEGFTASTTVTLSLAPSDACLPITVKLSNNNVSYGDSVTYDPNNPTTTWTIASGDGQKSVWAKFVDGLGNTRTVGPKTITLDQTRPVMPLGLNVASVSCSGSNRTVSLTWGAASDTNLVGYRLYRSIDSEPWTIVKVTASFTASDTHIKTLDSVRFRVVAYDKAGNESDPTQEQAFAKNQCS